MNNNKNAASDKAEHEKILNKFLNLKSVGIIVSIGVIVISVAKFIDSVTDLVNALPEPEATISAYDTKVQEQTLSVAKRIDDLCSNIIHSGVRPYAYDLYEDNYRVIAVDLQNLLLRQEVRPLNVQSIKQHELVIQRFSKLREYHQTKNYVTKALAKENRKLFHSMFKKILYLEATKPKT